MWEKKGSYYFHVRGNVMAGNGVTDNVGEEVKKLAVQKVILVSDQGVMKSGVCEPIIKSLKKSGLHVEVFDKVHSDPSVRIMDEIAALVKKNGAEAIVGVGGGSSLDAAKGAAIVVTNGGSIKDYIGEKKFGKNPLPVIAVPTTAGTGSEVTWHISVHDEEEHKKVTVRSPLCVPEMAFLDPGLLKGLPAHVAASTGMDAFAHSFESYISTQGAWLLTETLGLESVRLIGKNLRNFVADRGNLEAGGNMLVAAMLGGMCLSHARTGIVHQMARPLGAHYGIPHGLANAIMLAYAMEFCVEASINKFARVARIMEPNLEGSSDIEAAGKTTDMVRRLTKDIGLPQKLRDLGVKEEDLDTLADDAMQGKTIFENPCRGTKTDLLKIYREAY